MFAAIAGEAGCEATEIAAMAAALPGRGAGSSNLWLDESSAFAAASRTTHLLPEDTFDNQPFVDHELIFVGRARLDDRAGLLQQLNIDSTRGAALSDAHILQQCYKKWGDQAPQHVYGDFAFVAWERWSRRTVAATDHLGNFRLFYCRAAGRILFATQLGALLACPAVHPGLDVKSLGLLAAGKLEPDRTMFEGVKVLKGGEILIHEDELVRVERWWRPNTSSLDVHAHVRDYVAEARALFDSAVANRLRARGGIVTTLSGRLDSTLLAVTAAKHMAVSGKLLEAFTAISQPGLPVSPEPGWHADDAPWAAAVAEFQPNLRQRLISPTGMTPLDILPMVHAVTHTPVHDPAELVWRWQMSTRAAHTRARIILCSDHGNRSIGYVGDLSDAHFIRLRQIAGAALQTWDRVRCIGTHPQPPPTLATVAPSNPDSPSTAVLDDILLSAFRSEHQSELEGPLPASERDVFARAITEPRASARADFMAHFGVQWLDPTGDRKLLERLLTFPLHAFQVGNRPRGLARELGRGILPDSVRLRRARQVQFPDQAAWFALRAQDYRQLFQSIRESAACAFFLDIPRVEALLEKLYEGTGSVSQAALAHRVLDAGLFAVEFESSHRILSPPEFDASQDLSELDNFAPPVDSDRQARAW